MIGDGLGPAVMGVGQNYNELVLKTPPLYFQEAMKQGTTGLVTTRSADHLVTDSAAAATAMACGVKTRNDVVGLDENGRSVGNIFERAQKKDLSVGLVTTDRLTGATPAAFSSHVSHRRQNDLIASQEIQNRMTVMLGGGRDDFDLTEAKQAGYRVMTTKSALLDPASLKQKLWLGVFQPAEIPYVMERATDVPTLPEMAKAALARLARDPGGFVLMIEGARIDHAGHANEAKKMIQEFLEFDDTLGAVLDFLKDRSDTTVFITADHDTGGLALSKMDAQADYPTVDDFAKGRNLYWISHHHTAVPVLLVGLGPDGPSARGWHDNTDIFQLMKSALGL